MIHQPVVLNHQFSAGSISACGAALASRLGGHHGVGDAEPRWEVGMNPSGRSDTRSLQHRQRHLNGTRIAVPDQPLVWAMTQRFPEGLACLQWLGPSVQNAATHRSFVYMI